MLSPTLSRVSLSFTLHARRRMAEYSIQEQDVQDALEDPFAIALSHSGRKIYQRKLGEYVLRVIVEEEAGIKRIITAYKARSSRYEL
ncbi:MAG: DUF4258 domain-containing protein [archaeon]